MSAPLPRQAPLLHGGRLADACARFGGRAEQWLDLSTGINPEAWPVANRLQPDWRALPDPQALAVLEATAARYFGVDPALCMAVPGSEAGLRALAHVLGLPARHRALTYGTHASAFSSASPIASLPPAGAPDILVLAQPNNPDGIVTPLPDLHVALERQERSGGWLLVDEAFVDTAPGWSMAAALDPQRRLVVTRSFGKFFGLAGVRLGFVLGPPELLTRMRHLLGEWPVCAAAITFGTAAYADHGWIAATRAALPSRAMQLDAVLARHGLIPSGASPLFRLVDMAGRPQTAAHLFTALAQHHILTRPFLAWPTLLRLGLPANPAGLSRLDDALAQSLHDG